MDFDLPDLCRDVETFSTALFAGCTPQRRTRGHLGVCVRARLHEGQRKTHRPAGIRLAADEADADGLRQRINRAHLSKWSDGMVRGRLTSIALATIPAPVALIIDDTGFLKKGDKSPGVHRQYTGTAGKVTNCQVIVSTHLASHDASVPLEMDVYLPTAWTEAPERRSAAWIPEEVGFKTKGDIALEQLDRVIERGVPDLVALADAGYGDKGEWRDALRTRGLDYIVGVSGGMKVWRAGEGPDRLPVPSGRGRPKTRRFPGEFSPVEITALAAELGDDQWHDVDLRPETPGERVSRFAAVRVRTAHRAAAGKEPGPEEWLIIEWPSTDAKPSHYFLSSLTESTELDELARTAKLRWRVERDYQDAKQRVGLAHYEGRRWPGLNHHLTICMAAMTYLVASRRLSPPQASADTRGGRPPAPNSPHRPARTLSALQTIEIPAAPATAQRRPQTQSSPAKTGEDCGVIK